MPVKGTYLLLAGAGGVFLWSGLQGKSVSGVLRNLIAGRPPTNAANANQIASDGGLITNDVGTVNVTPPSGPGETAWIKAFLATIGAPVNAANVNSISSWIAHEGPYGTQAANNPLNTTLHTGNSTDFDGLAVQSYPSVSQGLAALAQTIESGAYNDLLMALRSGAGLCGRQWGGLATWSNNGYSQVC